MLPHTPSGDFVFPIYDDQPLVERLVIDLRRLYPESKLICIGDNYSPDFAQFARRNGVVFIGGRRLKLPEFGGLWLERLLSCAIAHSQAEYLVRTEGDTKFWRRFESIPNTDIAGTLEHRDEYSFPRGGCVLLKRTAIVKILESEVLKHDRYKNSPIFSYPRYAKYRYPGEMQSLQPILAGDLILGDVIDRLHLSLSGWNEVDIQFRGEPAANLNQEFAATHPHR